MLTVIFIVYIQTCSADIDNVCGWYICQFHRVDCTYLDYGNQFIKEKK